MGWKEEKKKEKKKKKRLGQSKNKKWSSANWSRWANQTRVREHKQHANQDDTDVSYIYTSSTRVRTCGRLLVPSVTTGYEYE